MLLSQRHKCNWHPGPPSSWSSFRTVLCKDCWIGRWGAVAEVPWPQNAVSETPLELCVTCPAIHGSPALFPLSKSLSSQSCAWQSQEKEGGGTGVAHGTAFSFPRNAFYFRLLTKWSWWLSQMPCNQTRLQTPGKLKWILMHIGNIRNDNRKLGNYEKKMEKP